MNTNVPLAPKPVRDPELLDRGGTSRRRILRIPPDILQELPDERSISIEINGCHAGTVCAVPDVLPELALGWAVMHGFLSPESVPERMTVADDRVSIMVTGDIDVETRRMMAVGWVSPDPAPALMALASPEVALNESGLLALIDTAWAAFRHDDGGDGYHHAAVASPRSVLCIARDRTPELAAAKVLGWILTEGRNADAAILLVRGMAGRLLVEAAARMGLACLITSGLPTAEAYRAAQGLPVSIIGMAASGTVGVLVNHGHLCGE